MHHHPHRGTDFCYGIFQPTYDAHIQTVTAYVTSGPCAGREVSRRAEGGRCTSPYIRQGVQAE